MSYLVTLTLLSILILGQCQDFAWIFTTPKVITYSGVSTTEGVTNNPVSTFVQEKTGCGWRQDTGLSKRITGDDDAFFGEYPWVVAIFKYTAKTNTYEYCCVGSLIHHKVVLTVKHYFKQPARIRIRAGDWDIADEYEIHYHQSSDVTRVIGHPKYKPSTNEYDVALLILSTSINLAPNVAFACLPPAHLITPSGTRCFVTGWGYDTFFNDKIRNILKMVDVPVVSNSVCQAQISTILNRTITLSDSMMCAGGEEGKDSCLKDGGAPLVCPYEDQKGRYYQAGIVSWGVRCGLPNVSGVYTSVPMVREWIDTTMIGLKNDITYLP